MSQYNINLPLFVNSTESGMVIPRLTTAQKIGVAATAGMLVYDTTLNDFEFYNGSNWISTGQSYTGPLFASSQIDAFGRVRTSNPFTLFDSSFRYRDNGKFSTTLIASGTGSLDSSTSVYSMNVSSNNSAIVRESTRVFPYQPGKSLLIMCSFVGSPDSYTQLGLTQRVGYVSSLNGIYLEIRDTVVYMNIMNNGVTSESVQQSNWNVDPLDGSGPSGITLDVTKAQIFFCDLEWLGVGTVNVGFVIDSQFIIVHKFFHANLITSTYMTTATLPITYAILTSGSYAVGSSTLKQICSTVISEGGYQPTTTKWYASLGTNTANIPTALTPLISIRLKSANLDSVVIPAQVDLFLTSNGSVQYQLILNGTLVGPAAWTSVDSNSSVEYSTNSTGISGGRAIDIGYVASGAQVKNSLQISGAIEFNYQLGRTNAGVSDILSLCAISFSGTQTASAAIGWYEL